MLTELDGDVWRVTLDRPETGNAIDPQLAEELAAAIDARPDAARTVLLLANGPRFSVAAGLVARLVEDGEVRDAAIALAHAVAAGPVRAMVGTRGLARQAAIRTLEQQLDDEARLIAESAGDPEGREGVRAFVEKRPPDFRGAR